MKNYEELYNEALERAKEHYHAGCFAPAILEYIFPELKKSEDDTMVELFKNLIAMTDKGTLNAVLTIYGKTKDDAISWLEKQGEKSQGKSSNNAEKVEPKFHKGDWVVIKK